MALDKAGLERLWQHITAKLGDKVDKVAGKGLSSNDFTNEDKAKLASLKGADWNINDENDPAYIMNRPFYTKKEEIEILNEAFSFDSDGTVYFEGALTGGTPFASQLYEGETYTVIWDSVEYKCIARKAQYEDEYYIGNQEFAEMLWDYEFPEHIVSNEPFIICACASMETGDLYASLGAVEGNHTVVINGPDVHIVTIDRKYLPQLVGKSGTGYYAEIFNSSYNTASGDYSHAEGMETVASGENAHAEGEFTEASGEQAHAEGSHTIAVGFASHAEGSATTAEGSVSHTEGYYTIAGEPCSHAEGEFAVAFGEAAHAEGVFTNAYSYAQHVQGKFNIVDDSETYAHIVGNGNDSDQLSNAHTLDWEGNAWYSGDVYVGSTSGTNRDEGSKKLATEDFVSNAISAIPTPDVSGQIAEAMNELRQEILGGEW